MAEFARGAKLRPHHGGAVAQGQIPQSLCVRLELAMIFAALSDPPRQDPPDGVATWTRSARRPPHRLLTVSTTRSTKTPTVSAAILIASM